MQGTYGSLANPPLTKKLVYKVVYKVIYKMVLQDPLLDKGGVAGVRGRSPQPLGAVGALREPWFPALTMRNMLHRIVHQEKPIDEVRALVARHEPP